MGAATEGELGDGLVSTMKVAGGDQAGWPPIVATGPNAARPHHRAGDDKLGDGVLLLDYGCVVDGYHSDMSRTVWVGGDVEDEVAAVHAAVLEANEEGIAAVAPGVEAGAVDAVCRDVLRRHGYEEHFLHSTGHGVGLDIHESPAVRRGSEEVLAPGQVITIEPGVYLPGRFGVRIEDMVLVTEAGHEVLTTSSKELEPA
jgi:Xaa-Pro aminopeptidase